MTIRPLLEKTVKKQSSIVSAIELWQSNKQGSSLSLKKAFYGTKTSFLQASLGICFAWGKGLPGKVAQSKSVQIWSDSAGLTEFKRAKLAREVNINAAIGIPIMPNGTVKTVILLLLTLQSTDLTQTAQLNNHPSKTAVELWQPNALGILSLAKSLYTNVDSFAKLSETQGFSVLEGLPGRVFDTQNALLFPNLSNKDDFVRKDIAKKVALDAALGLPILEANNTKSALLLFTARANPFVKAIEHWRVTKKGTLELEAGYYGDHEAFGDLSKPLVFKADEGVPGNVFAQKQAMLFNSLAPGGGFVRANEAEKTGFEVALGIPIFNRGKVISVVVLIN